MKRIAVFLIVLGGTPCLAAAEKAAVPRVTPQAAEFFEKRVRPVLVDHCVACHGPKKQKGDLRLDSRAAMIAGNDSGPAIVPGNAERSNLIQAIRYNTTVKMPPPGKLSASAIDALTAWVKMGAPWPDGRPIVLKATGSGARVDAKRHWAFQPARKPALPSVRDAKWPTSPVDYFILAKLEANRFTPAQRAERRTLLRRASFDLIGLPPTAEEIAAFEGDQAPDALARVVNRLLESPRYGERWGRYWLDVARYADTKGYVFTEERGFPYSYTYRDYVIRAFNEDLPYDQFILQQLAADLLPHGDDNRSLAALGFLTIGRRFLNNPHDIIDDRIDVTARGLLGLTVSCARCHDHKFDPIPTKDYYSLYGVFASSREPAELPLIGAPPKTPEYLTFVKELNARQGKLDALVKKHQAALVKKARAQVADYLLAAHELKPGRRRGKQAPAVGDLSMPLVRRWRDFLKARESKPDAIFGPWRAFAALNKNDFPSQGAVLAKRFAEASAESVNPAVAGVLAGKAPKSLKEVAGFYGTAFAETEKLWQQTQDRAGLKEAKPGLAALPDAGSEALRQVIYGPGSPFSFPPAELGRYVSRDVRDKIVKLRQEVEKWQIEGPGAPPRAMVLADLPNPVSPHVLLRGNPNSAGPVVPRQFLQVLAGAQRKPFEKGSGRLDLARAIASKDNPLTARVMVNRIWMHHFGAGLVRTPSDFGLRSDPPTHPELLDYLAARFVEEGWSIKKMHRLIMLSSAYQQDSENRPEFAERDPDNRWLWKMNRRRLDFEAMRDSLLAVSGNLDLTMGGRSVDLTKAPFTGRRTVYGFVDRQNLPGLFRTFDFASPDVTSPQRYATTVPQQALFLMNSPFVVEQARRLAGAKDFAALNRADERIQYLYRRVYARKADEAEVKLGFAFLDEARKLAENPGKDGLRAAPSLTPWERYAQVLLLGDEFMFVD